MEWREGLCLRHHQPEVSVALSAISPTCSGTSCSESLGGKPSACKLNAFGQASGHFPRIAINPVEGSSSSYLISRGRTGYSNDESATILLPSQRLKTSLFTNRCLAPLNQKLQEHLQSNFLKETRQVVFFAITSFRAIERYAVLGVNVT